MQYLLFDIDGTLLLSGGAGRVAMSRIMDQMFGLQLLEKIEVHGRTDFGIINDLFDAHDLEVDAATKSEFTRRYHIELPDCMHECEGTLMPGVNQLLEALSGVDEVRLGILTGNSGSAATTKLVHFKLDQYFMFGGYGENHSRRDDVAREALAACVQCYPDSEVRPDQVWVIGDTIHDISCARSISANVVAVATGGSDLELLRQHSPDVLLDDLTDVDGFLGALSIPVSGGPGIQTRRASE